MAQPAKGRLGGRRTISRNGRAQDAGRTQRGRLPCAAVVYWRRSVSAGPWRRKPRSEGFALSLAPGMPAVACPPCATPTCPPSPLLNPPPHPPPPELPVAARRCLSLSVAAGIVHAHWRRCLPLAALPLLARPSPPHRASYATSLPARPPAQRHLALAQPAPASARPPRLAPHKSLPDRFARPACSTDVSPAPWTIALQSPWTPRLLSCRIRSSLPQSSRSRPRPGRAQPLSTTCPGTSRPTESSSCLPPPRPPRP